MRRSLRALLMAALVSLAASTAGAVSARELLDRAFTAEARGDLPTAARSLEELVAAGVDSDGVLYDLGTVYARQERYGEAIWCFERVLRRAPLMWPARDNLRATRMLLASAGAGYVAWGLVIVLTRVLSSWGRIGYAVTLVLGGVLFGVVYLLVARLLRIEELAVIAAPIVNRLDRRPPGRHRPQG